VSRADPVRLYYGLTFVRAMPGWVVVDLLLVRVLELSPLQLILMGTAMEATVFVCEVPTGVVADTYSRRLSLIIGFVGMGIAVVGVGAASAAWVVIALWALWGLSYTFTSGAFQAWITDEVGVEKVGGIFMRGARVGFAGGLIGLGVSVAIGVVSLRAAVIFGGVIEIACGLACIFLMPETGFTRQPRSERRRALRELSETAANGFRFVRAQRLVLLLVVTELFAGFGAEAFDRLTEAHVIRDVGVPLGTNPLYWFAPIPAVAMVFGYFAIGPMIRRVDRGGTPSVARMLVLFTSATIATQLAFALGVSFAFVMTMWLAAVLTRSLVSPLYDTWLNSQITDSSVRATVFSISGQANAIGQATGGPVVGGIGNAFGIPAALATGALTLLPAVGLYARALRHGGAEAELEAMPSPAQTY
jgi:DHA3 family tetracycline resistance protein-like MFS transporter